MYLDVILPNLGFGMEEGRLLTWLKAPGDSVRKGEAIAEVESDKTTVELEALADGVLETLLVEADTMLPVGTVLARIRTGAEAPVAAPQHIVSEVMPLPSEPVQASPVARRLAQERGLDLANVVGSGPGGRITREDVEAALNGAPTNGTQKPQTAPAVRKLARDRGLDLSLVSGSGANGRITRADVEAALIASRVRTLEVQQVALADDAVEEGLKPSSTDDTGYTEIPLSPIRKTIARRLAQSMQETPHFYVSAELDFTDALKTLPPEIGINNLLLYLTVAALRDVPAFNATFEDGRLYHYPHVNLAVAVALPDGLITPVLRGADDFSLAGLANRARDLVTRARAGRLKPDELSGGTFTISNLGVVQQIDHFTAIINPPQVGILAVGALRERPAVINGGLHIRSTAFLTVSADHRVLDGLVAARFIEAFDGRLQAFKG